MTEGLPYSLGRMAEADFDDIWYYIGKQNQGAADRVLEELRKAFRMLGKSPLLGEGFDPYRPFLRRFTHENYVIYYNATTEPITIVRVLHGARDSSGLV